VRGRGRSEVTLRRVGVLVAVVVLGACTSESVGTTAPTATATSPATVAVAAVTTTTATVPPTVATTTIAPTTIAPTTAAATTTTTTTTEIVQQIEIGRSVEGRPITAIERGTPGGRVVLVIGCIHGDEDAGVAVVDELTTAPIPPGVDLWLVPSLNPDGVAHQTRTNARQVDLNRNFPRNWAPLGQPGDSQYAGTGPASEPETAAVVGLIEQIHPALAMWYHQDLYRIDPGTGPSGEIRRRYAELTGLPIVPVTGGIYTGTATQWESATVPEGVAFIVELGPTLDERGAKTHADAVLTLASTG
jgi:murein peptide amidase A